MESNPCYILISPFTLGCLPGRGCTPAAGSELGNAKVGRRDLNCLRPTSDGLHPSSDGHTPSHFQEKDYVITTVR